MDGLIRSLAIRADGEAVKGYSRARLSGGERMEAGAGPYPYLFTLRLWNLPEDGYLALSRCRTVSVLCGEAELAVGRACGAVRENTRKGVVTTACFSPGLPLWEARVSLSAEAGASVADTVGALLRASGTGIRLLTADGTDGIFPRGQAYCGRAAECVGEALSFVGARACLVPSGLCAVPAGGVPVSVELGEGDLLGEPEFPSADRMILRTRAAGWTLGKGVRAVWKGAAYTGLICERSFDLDTGDGPWRTELVLEVTA